MNLTTFKILIFILLTSFYSYSQTDISSLKVILTNSIDEFEKTAKTRQDLKYINTFYFKKILSNFDIKTIPVAFQCDSTERFYFQLNIMAYDTSFSFHYYNWSGFQSESHHKGCQPNDKLVRIEKNMITGCTAAENVVAIDTLCNVIITKPAVGKYVVWRTGCRNKPSKTKAKNDFKERIWGQYQLIIYINKGKTTGYFVAPPNPKDKINVKHKSSNF